MKLLVHTEELCSRSVPLEHAPGAKSLVCIGLKRTHITIRKRVGVVDPGGVANIYGLWGWVGMGPCMGFKSRSWAGPVSRKAGK